MIGQSSSMYEEVVGVEIVYMIDSDVVAVRKYKLSKEKVSLIDLATS